MSVRKAAVANLFYPGEKGELNRQLSTFLDPFLESAKHETVAAIVPHAGYIYSGNTAAQAFAQIDYKNLDCILLLGPAHRVPLKGMALSRDSEFETPLGRYPLSTNLINQIVDADLAKFDDQAHLNEHSLEVQIPFLQNIGVAIPLIPVVVGWSTPNEVASLIEFIDKRARVLVLVSSDLSHFHTYSEARIIDQRTTARILDLETNIQPEEACGCMAVNGLLHWLNSTGKRITLVDQCNSGDTAGDKQRVVGYASYIVYQ